MWAFDAQGNMFVCMGRSHIIRRMDAKTGIITSVAGTGEAGYTGDSGPARSATFDMHYALTVDANGDIYIAERRNAVVRKIDGTTGMVTTLAGTGEIGYSGDGGPGNKAMLREPNDVFLDGKEGLLIADIQDQRIRRVDLRTGMIPTFAGTGEKSRDGDGRRAAEASLMGPRAVCMDRLGNTYVCEREGNGVRKIDPNGILTTVAGAESVFGYSGDGGPALAAGLARPHGCTVDPAGNLCIADTHNNKVRVVGL